MGLGTKILMVHSDSAHLHQRASHFSGLGFSVTTAQDIAAAIDATTRTVFDVVEIALDPGEASHLRTYLERCYHDVSIFVLSGSPTCRTAKRGRPASLHPQRDA